MEENGASSGPRIAPEYIHSADIKRMNAATGSFADCIKSVLETCDSHRATAKSAPDHFPCTAYRRHLRGQHELRKSMHQETAVTGVGKRIQCEIILVQQTPALDRFKERKMKRKIVLAVGVLIRDQ